MAGTAEERRQRCASLALEVLETDLAAIAAKVRRRDELTGQELNRFVQYLRVVLPQPQQAKAEEPERAPGLHLDLVKRLAKTAGQ